MANQDSFSNITYSFYSRYNTVWITKTESRMDPKNSVIKRLWCSLKFLLWSVSDVLSEPVSTSQAIPGP